MDYANDIFISYSYADHAWSDMLAADLRKRGLTVFLDTDRLQPGAEWNPALVHSVDASRHLVVIWSENARDSDWVRRERGKFEARWEGDLTPTTNRLMPLLLEGEMKAYGILQAITDLRDAGAYAAGADQVDKQLWDRVVNRITNAVHSQDSRVPVPIVVMAMSEDRLGQIDFDKPPDGGGDSLAEFLASVGLAPEDLNKYYGARRVDWRPLGCADTIESLLLKLNAEINKKLGSQQFRWDFLGEEFWGKDPDAAEAEARRLTAGNVSVVVIDPLSLYDGEVRWRFNNLLDPPLNYGKAIFVLLPPFAIPDIYTNFRKLVRLQAMPIFRRFYDPNLDSLLSHAEFNVHVADEVEFKRALLVAFGRHMYKPQGKEAHTYIRTA